MDEKTKKETTDVEAATLSRLREHTESLYRQVCFPEDAKKVADAFAESLATAEPVYQDRGKGPEPCYSEEEILRAYGAGQAVLLRKVGK